MGFSERNYVEAKIKRNLIKDEDKNTKLFHKMANARKRRNFFIRVKSEWGMIAWGSRYKGGGIQGLPQSPI